MKFRKGNKIIASRSHPRTGDRSYSHYVSEVLHKAPHHYVIQTKYGKSILTMEDIEAYRFVKATKKMVALDSKE